MTDIQITLTEEQLALKKAVADLCQLYPGAYWRELDEKREYPEAFVQELSKAGYLAALIPEAYGGSGLGILEGGLILEEVNRSGGNAAACHAQMYIMGTLLRHGSDEQKGRYLPQIASGALRRGDTYVVNGQKIFISRVMQSDLMLLLARTTPLAEVRKRTEGLSVFLIDIRDLPGFEARPLHTMLNHSTNVLFFEDVEIPADSLVGVEGKGFSHILDVLVASQSIGDGRWFVEKAAQYARDRVIFGKPIGANQGVQFPIAKAHMAVEAADLMRLKAAAMFDGGEPCGPEANMAKYLSAEAAWEAANACLDCHGGYGFASEYDVERKFRETRLYKTAPVNNNLVLAYVGQHVLGMPRSY